MKRWFINNLKFEEIKSDKSISFVSCKTTNLLQAYYVLRNFRKNKDIVITKSNKGNGVIILDRKLYDNSIQEIISDTSKFEMLNEEPTLKREASLQCFSCKLKKKNFFNEKEYGKLCPSGSAPAGIYGTPKMHKFSSSDTFSKLCPIVSSIGTFNYILLVSFMIFFQP